jgi:hypothetical protein
MLNALRHDPGFAKLKYWTGDRKVFIIVHASGTFHIISGAVIGSHALDIPLLPCYTVTTGTRDRSVSRATKLQAKRPRNLGSIPGVEKRPTLGPTHPPVLILGLFLVGVKRHGREADHSFPSSADVKNYAAIPPLLTRLRGLCFIH